MYRSDVKNLPTAKELVRNMKVLRRLRVNNYIAHSISKIGVVIGALLYTP